MPVNQVIYIIVLSAAILFFAWTCVRRFGIFSSCEPSGRFNDIPLRIWYLLAYVFGQKRVVQKPYGVNHFLIFWSFIILLLSNGMFLINGAAPSVSFDHFSAAVRSPLFFLFDIISLLALASVVIAAIRRVVKPPFAEAITLEAFAILLMIGLLMIAYFNLHGVMIALGTERNAASMPVSAWVANLFYQGMDSSRAGVFLLFWWWVHAVVLLVFLNYLPYSKHMHILTVIPNVFLSRLTRPNTMPRENFEAKTVFGAGVVNRFAWKDLLDTYTCTECGRCQNVCPASGTGKPLNPRLVMHQIKTNLIKNASKLKKGKETLVPLIGSDGKGSVSEDAIWSCTTCGACMEVCPVLIEQMPKLIHLRRHLVEMEAKFPEELSILFENMEQRSNPWGVAPATG